MACPLAFLAMDCCYSAEHHGKNKEQQGGTNLKINSLLITGVFLGSLILFALGLFGLRLPFIIAIIGVVIFHIFIGRPMLKGATE